MDSSTGAEYFHQHALVDQWTTSQDGSLTPNSFFNKSSAAAAGNVFTPVFEPKDYFASFHVDHPDNSSLQGRKRALSSPALTPGVGAFVNDHWGSDDHQHHPLAPSFHFPQPSALQNVKRPRLQHDDVNSSSLSSLPAIVSSSGDTSDSPQSTSVVTPPDTEQPPMLMNGLHQGKNPTAIQQQQQAPIAQSAANGVPDLAQLANSRRQFAQKQAQIEQVNPSAKTMPSVLASVPQAVAKPAPALARNAKGDAPSVLAQPITTEIAPPGHADSAPKPAMRKFEMSRFDAEQEDVKPFAAAQDRGSEQPATKKGKGRPSLASATGSTRGRKPRKAQFVDEEDEDSKRKAFLERNRLAACKSRQKKKERVNSLEGQAHDLCVRNQQLQSIALSLRQEVLQLRNLLNIHDGCSCEHVVGYVQRETSGGGIPTIHALAGRVFSLDYSNVPTMGSTDDVFGELARQTCVHGDFSDDDSASQRGRRASTTSTHVRMRSAPINAPSFEGTAMPEDGSIPPRPARVTRSSTIQRQREEEQRQQQQIGMQLRQQQQHMQQSQMSHFAGSLSPGKHFPGLPSVLKTGLSPLPFDGSAAHHEFFSHQHMLNGQEISRPSSAPASTPGWDKFSPNDTRDSYFSFNQVA